MEFLFVVKKLLGWLIAPLPIVFFLLGAALILCRCGWKKAGIRVGALSLIAFLFMSMPLTSQLLLKPLEFKFPKLPLENRDAMKALDFDYIVVLGCWHRDDEQLPLIAKPAACSLARTTQAVQIWHQFPRKQLIFTGSGANDGGEANPEINAQIAQSLGVSENNITVISGTKDTDDEAAVLRSHLADSRFVVISSASHLARIQYIFAQHQLSPILSPAEYHTAHGKITWRSFIPRASALRQSEVAIYEALGNIWVRLKTLF